MLAFCFSFVFLETPEIVNSGESILDSSYTRVLPICQVLPEKLFSQVPIQTLRREDCAIRYTLSSVDWPTSGMLYPSETVLPYAIYGKVSAGEG